jgi:RHS repeat-associated protein
LKGGDGTDYESKLFFYHGDHLSSTQMITDINANVVQQVLYAPFGEVITEYNAYWHNGLVPDYMFNAKELDEESGMYYYEARYYNPPTFISRDPLFEKYPFMSPYAYCANNPVKLIDPTGMDWEKPEDVQKANELIKTANNKIASNNKLINKIEKDINKKEQKGKADVEFMKNSLCLISDLKDRNTLLEDGIKGLEEMGASEQVFAFKEVSKENGEWYYNTRRDNGIIDIGYSTNNVAWHESVHVADYLRNPMDYGFDNENRLGFKYGVDKNRKELDAYRSEFSFNSSSLLFLNIGGVHHIDFNWMKANKLWKY